MSRRGPYRTNISKGGPPARDGQREQNLMAEALDDLSEFEQFKADMLPKLRSQLAAGASTKDILGTARAVAVARLATIAVMEGDTKLALSAIKELLERTDGKVTEKKEITHQLASMPTEELDALLITAATEDDSED